MTTSEPTVLVASPLEAEYVEQIAAADPTISVRYEPDLLPAARYPGDHHGEPKVLRPTEERRWRSALASAEVTFGIDWWQPERMRANCPRLRWVQGTSAGMAGYLRSSGLWESEVEITTAAGVHAVPLAEFALAGTLYFVKRLAELGERQRSRRWERLILPPLAGQRVLVVGLGAIGREVARVFSALRAEVWGVGRPAGSAQVAGLTRQLTTDQLPAALPGADVVVLCTPLTTETAGLLGARELRLLPRDAILVNLARGGVLDESALIDALDGDRLGGAVLDVFTTEPLPVDSPLWTMDRVLVSPHSAANAETENAAITELFVDNLRRWRAGEPLHNRFDRARGY